MFAGNFQLAPPLEPAYPLNVVATTSFPIEPEPISISYSTSDTPAITLILPSFNVFPRGLISDIQLEFAHAVPLGVIEAADVAAVADGQLSSSPVLAALPA